MNTENQASGFELQHDLDFLDDIGELNDDDFNINPMVSKTLHNRDVNNGSYTKKMNRNSKKISVLSQKYNTNRN